MNNLLLSALLAADGAAESTRDIWDVVPQYITFGVVIVISIVLLVILRKTSRLPRHPELKKQVASLAADIAAIDPGAKRIDFIKSVSRAMYKADNISYDANMLAEKERYGDLGTVSKLIADARAELSAYKFGAREPGEGEGLAAAAKKVQAALATLDNIIERDSELKSRK